MIKWKLNAILPPRKNAVATQGEKMKKKVAVLGAGGSIGRGALDVIRERKDLFEGALFAVDKNLNCLEELFKEFPTARFAAVSADKDAASEGLKKRLYCGKDAVLRALEDVKPDAVVNGVSGAAGLLPSLKAVEIGCNLALANKESVVMAWDIIKEAAQKSGSVVIPVDSECSAIFNLVNQTGKENLRRIILTASGGPFRDASLEELREVDVEKALRHPTWKMGPKITLDSSTLANKGLEVIQISKIMEVSPSIIDVSVHRQSIVHSLISLKDGAVYAALSKPDMRLPIHQALHYPLCESSRWGEMDFENDSPLSLTFEKPDCEKFPLLPLAFHAAKAGGFYPAAYNAANEIADERFIKGDASFLDIPKITASVLEADWAAKDKSLTLEAVLEADSAARRMAWSVKC